MRALVPFFLFIAFEFGYALGCKFADLKLAILHCGVKCFGTIVDCSDQGGMKESI